jgi:hypothetical protein
MPYNNRAAIRILPFSLAGLSGMSFLEWKLDDEMYNRIF